MFLTKKLTIKTERATSSEEEVKLKYFMYFSWPPLRAGLSMPTF
jgi:hypothetical protein